MGKGSGNATTRSGYPIAAEPCRCPDPVGTSDGCVICGHLHAHVIAATWANRARKLETKATPLQLARFRTPIREQSLASVA